MRVLWARPEMGSIAIAACLGLPSKNYVIGMARRMELGDKPAAPGRSAETVAVAKEARLAANRTRHKADRERIAALPPEQRPERKQAARKPRAPKPAVVAAPVRVSIPGVVQGAYEPAAEVIITGTKSTLELGPSDCRWPIGHPGAVGFSHCGRKKSASPDIPYCADHARVAYTPLPARSGAKPLKQWFGGKR